MFVSIFKSFNFQYQRLNVYPISLLNYKSENTFKIIELDNQSNIINEINRKLKHFNNIIFN